MQTKTIFKKIMTTLLAGVLTLPALAREWYVDQNKSGASDTGAGTEAKPFKTISRAAELAEAGDRVVINSGIYRECVQPVNSGTAAAPIVYQAAPKAEVVIKGSDIFTATWEKVKTAAGGFIYKASLDEKLFKGYKMPWSEKFFYTTNPFHTKVIISASSAKELNPKRSYSQHARPWPEAMVISKEEGKEKDTFDTYKSHTVYDGPEGSLPRTLGQIFVDGRPVQQVRYVKDVEMHGDTFIVSADGKSLLMHLHNDADPNKHEVEITTRAQIFVPAKRQVNYIHVKGLVLEHCANQGSFPQAGALSTRSGSHWIIENNTIRYAKTLGLDCGGEGYTRDAVKGGRKMSNGNIVRNNIISDNGLCGIAVYSSRNTLITGNVLERNCRLGYTPGIDAGWWELSAIKLHISPGVVIEENLVRDNDCFGIWLDTGYADSTIRRNLVVNNMLAGIFLECGVGPVVIDNNIVAFTRSGHGIYAHDASGVLAAHNLVFRNSHFGVLMRNVSNRKARGKICETSNNSVLNNLILGNGQGTVSLPVLSARDKNNISDYNVYTGGTQLYDNGESLFGLISRQDRDLFKTGKYADVVKAGNAMSQSWKDEQVLITRMDSWQELTGYDKHSTEPFSIMDKYLTFRSRLLNFELNVPEELSKLRVPPIAGISKDYFGNELPEGQPVLPGPFNEIPEGRTVLYLWPLAK